MSRAIDAAQPLIASVVQDGHRRTRQSRRTLIDAQRQSHRWPKKNTCRTPVSKASCTRYRPPLHLLIAAAVLIQIVARPAASSQARIEEFASEPDRAEDQLF